MDAGMFLQSVMLFLRDEEIDTCPQIAWGEYHRSIAEAAAREGFPTTTSSASWSSGASTSPVEPVSAQLPSW
jgi:hypothetical protein